MPNAADVAAGRSTGSATTVSSTGDAMYGYLSASYGWSRIDHAQFGGGAMASLEFKDVSDTSGSSPALGPGACWPTDVTHADYLKFRTCFVIPPDEAASAPAPTPALGSLCDSSGMSSDPNWGDKIVQCASSATECEVYEKLDVSGTFGGTCGGFCASYGLTCSRAYDDEANDCTHENAGTADELVSCNERLGTTSDKICVCRAGTSDRKVNAHKETHAEALAACQTRCVELGKYGCSGINIVPLNAPALVRFTSTATDAMGSSERAIPWGVSNCDATCFAAEPADITASAMVCYPLEMAKGDAREVEEAWTVSVSDTSDATWYSTAFLREQTRTFAGIMHSASGLAVDCTTYTSPEFPTGMCQAAYAMTWRHGQRCISCADADANADIATTLPFWQPLPADECRMCARVAATATAPTKAPTKAPTAPGSSAWSAPGNVVSVAWAAAASGAGYTFTIVCAGCTDSTGWVALGINAASTMVNTNAVRWRLTENVVDETVRRVTLICVVVDSISATRPFTHSPQSHSNE